MMRLALDHITIVDANPIQLAETARSVGCDAMCLFLESMPVLPLMPAFSLIDDQSARKALKCRMDDLGVTLDMAYPFTLGGRTMVADFKRALDCAAELQASLINVLIYDRDSARREDNLLELCDLARPCGLQIALEFYPISQLRSLSDALALVAKIGRPGEVGVNADLLHLMRSGSTIDALAAAPAGSILYGQFCDGPATCPPEEFDKEASSDRLLPGEGVFDIADFAKALPEGCPVSVETPRNARIRAGASHFARAQDAVEAVRKSVPAGKP